MCLRNYLRKKDGIMVNIIKEELLIEELLIEELLKRKLEVICDFSNEIFIENLSNTIKLSELEDYLKTI